MKLNTNNTTSRILLSPVAILVMVVVWLLAGWELGLLCAGLVVYLSPELMVMFSKRWRVLKAEADREEEERIRQLYEELDRKYKDTNWDNEPMPPMERFDDTGCPGIMM